MDLIFFQGCKIKMDDSGNILVKRISKSNVYVKNTTEENAVSNDILKVMTMSLRCWLKCLVFDATLPKMASNQVTSS